MEVFAGQLCPATDDMVVLVAKFRSGAEFLEHFLSDQGVAGGLFLPTRRLIDPATPLLIDVRLPELRDHLLIRATVGFVQRGRRNPLLRAGLGLEFLPQEQSKAQFLCELARGTAGAASQRKQRRLPIDLLVHWRLPDSVEKHQSVVGDIGTGGAFLRTASAPPAGTAVLLEIVPPGSASSHTIEGRVAWQRGEGAGIEFRCRDIAGMRRLRELVRRIEGAPQNS